MAARAGGWLNTLRRLTWRERLLLVEAFGLLGLGRATVLCIPFKRVAPYLGAAMQETDHSVADANASAIARAILRVSRHTPWNSNCFAQALAGHVMLRRRHAASTLYLGVRKDGEIFSAHAWLRNGNLIVTGGKGHELYTPIARYGWQP